MSKDRILAQPMKPNFKDYFSKQAAIYAKARPSYPDELFEYLSSLCNEHNLVWDCATGNGQAAVSLSHYFKKVIATDASKEQLKLAKPRKNITYRMALAEDSGIKSGTVDMVIVANALHWFNLKKFYAEVDRVLKPGGVLAFWAYKESTVNSKADKVMKHLAREILRDYWPEANKLVVSGYKGIALPYKEIKTPVFNFKTEATIKKLEGFAYSWSSTQRYIKKHGKDPVAPVMPDLIKAWGKAKTRPQTWHLSLKVCRKPGL